MFQRAAAIVPRALADPAPARQVHCAFGQGVRFWAPGQGVCSSSRHPTSFQQELSERREMVAGTGRLTARKSTDDSGPDDVSLRQASRQGSHESDWAEVSCAFCHGTGTDPFGIMSWLSACCVCKGRSTIQVQGPQERCAHCRGTGAVKRLTCTVCGGKGLVPLRAVDTVVCRECQGTGDAFSASALPCLKCRGRGWVVSDAGNRA